MCDAPWGWPPERSPPEREKEKASKQHPHSKKKSTSRRIGASLCGRQPPARTQRVWSWRGEKQQQPLLLRPFDTLPSTQQKPPSRIYKNTPHLRRYSRPIVVTRVSGDLRALSGGVLPGRASRARIGNQGPFTQVCESQPKSPSGPRQYSSMTVGGGGVS